jgi:hypothetical protein
MLGSLAGVALAHGKAKVIAGNVDLWEVRIH